MKKIYYGFMRDSKALAVPCPHTKSVKVGSGFCQGCAFYEKTNEAEQFVICDAEVTV